MTTIAYRNKVMASDTLLSGEDIKWTNCVKIKKIKGWLIGASGGWDLSEAFMRRFDPIMVKAGHIALPSLTDKDFTALIISPAGKVYYTEGGGIIGSLKTKGFIAIGSGETVAMAAMEFGASAIEAVRIAMKYDLYTGGRVHKIRL